MSIKDSVFFYTRNDYLIINSLLCNRTEDFFKICEIVNNDSIGVLKEHKDGIRSLDPDSVRRYENRVYSNLNDDNIDKIKSTAKEDIRNILNAMDSSKCKLTLYRTIWNDRINDTFNDDKIGDIIIFNNISSTSTYPYRENEEKYYYRFEIEVPKNNMILELNQFDPFIRNEDDEVLLPPMRCEVLKILDSDNEYCNGIIRLRCIEQIKPNLEW